MLLIVGLGNPGAQYAHHRHNAGFMAADIIHRRQSFSPWRRRFQALVAEATVDGEKCLLIKPQTFMNESGRAVQEAVRFYKLEPKDVLVIHDEVDLAPGKIRMKADGGVAGHNGLRSIGAAIGNGFRRLRIGVGHPGVKDLVASYVLHDFAKADAAWLEPLVEAIADNLPLLIDGNDQTFANRLNEALARARPVGKAAKVKAATKGSEGPPPHAAPSAEPAEARTEGPFARGLRKLFGRSEKQD